MGRKSAGVRRGPFVLVIAALLGVTQFPLAAPAMAVAPDCDFTTAYTTVGSTQCVVPAGVTAIRVQAWGGTGGGDGQGQAGGRGTQVTGTITVSPGNTLTIFVGGKGGTPTGSLKVGGVGGYNGGGAGGDAPADGSTFTAAAGGGGGGATVVVLGGTEVVVAGGGGGAGYGASGNNNVSANGARGDGQDATVGGFGATPSAVGAGGYDGSAGAGAGTDGNPGLGSAGGAGGSSNLFWDGTWFGGGGGGGGAYGGGGGGIFLSGGGGGGAGGGGSSLGPAGVSFSVNPSSPNSGNGQVSLSLPPTYAVTFAGNGSDGGSTPAITSTAGALVVPGNTGGLTNSGYQFQGWFVTPAPVSGGQYPLTGATITINTATTLTARWGGGPLEFRSTPTGSALSTIPFPNTPSGQTSTLTVYVRNVGLAAVSSISTGLTGPPPNQTGLGTCSGTIQPYNNGAVADCTYTFSWTSNGSPLSETFTVSYFTSNSVTLTGTALPQYTVAYNGNGSTSGSAPVDASSPYVSGGTVTVLGNTGSLAKSGFTFAGWNTASNGSGTSYAAGATFTAGVNTTLYAQWTANGGGGGGGGGGSSGSDPSTPSPSPVPSSSTVVTPVNAGSLGPVEPSSVTGLRPGGSEVLVGGASVSAVSSPNRVAGSVTTSGEGWSVTTGGRGPSGSTQPLSPSGAVQVPQGGSLVVSGTGYQPESSVQVYGLNPGVLLGTLVVDAGGNFAGTVVLPATFIPGNAVVQLNGYTPTLSVRSLSMGVKVVKDAASTVRKSEVTVFFAAGSSWLDPKARTALAKFVKAIPRGATSIRVVSVGYVQGTSDRSNDFTLSTARATSVANQLKADKLRGQYYVTGRGVAKEQGAKGRKVIVTISYRVK